MTPEPMEPEWCIVATLLPYPYRGEKAEFRSHGIFPAGAKLHVIGGFARSGNETVTVVGFSHGRPAPVIAHLPYEYLGGFRVRLVYRPAILRAIHRGEAEQPRECHRFRRTGGPAVTSTEYRDHLQRVAAYYQVGSAALNP